MAQDWWEGEVEDISKEANDIWTFANILRNTGTCQEDHYGDFILPMVVLRPKCWTLASFRGIRYIAFWAGRKALVQPGAGIISPPFFV